MASHPVCAMVWEGTNAIQIGRKMMGETNPFESLPGTIRGDYCIEIGRNVIHGSDSEEAAKKESHFGSNLKNYPTGNKLLLHGSMNKFFYISLYVHFTISTCCDVCA